MNEHGDITEAEADPLWLSAPNGTQQSYTDPKVFYVVRPFHPWPVIEGDWITFRDHQRHRLRWWECCFRATWIERYRRPNLCRAIAAGFFYGRLRVRKRETGNG